ncbi:MAG: dihydroneopterin aldolase [Nitrospiraceae bacterium]
MAGHIVIERLEFQGHCGVIPEERQHPQPLAVDAELDCPTDGAAVSDDIDQAVDYARVAERIFQIGSTQDCCLLETLADRLVNMLFAEFPVERVRLWVRKLDPPLTLVTGSVGVRLDRTRLSQQVHAGDPMPAQFLTQHLHRLPKGTALDIASGTGRNALYLAAHGYHVEAIDRDEQALDRLSTTARQRHLPNLFVRTVDLENGNDPAPEFPKEQYDVIIVFFYLFRSLFPAILDALKPNGMLLYETFLIDNYFRHHHPRRWEFCLSHNELLRLTSRLRVLHYDEGEHEAGHGTGPAFTARLIAQKVGKTALHHEPAS